MARLVVYSCGTDTFHVSTDTLRDRARDWFGMAGRYGDRPSYGFVAGVLELLQAHGFMAWARAYVHRWHRHLSAEVRRVMPHPRKNAAGEYRHQARKLHVCGRLRALLGSQGGSDRRTLPLRSVQQSSSIRPALGAQERAQPTGAGPPAPPGTGFRGLADAARQVLGELLGPK